MGKKDDSAMARKKSAQTPEGDCTQSRDLSYICLTQLTFWSFFSLVGFVIVVDGFSLMSVVFPAVVAYQADKTNKLDGFFRNFPIFFCD